MKKNLLLFIFCSLSIFTCFGQKSVARRWNDVTIMAIRQDFARPPVQARNLYHISLAMYDAWATYDAKATTYLIGNVVGGQSYTFNGIPPVSASDTISSENMAISYAAYRTLIHLFSKSPNAAISKYRFDTLMVNLGYDTSYISTNYQTGTPADLGNYIAQQVIQMGYNDGSNEAGNYAPVGYAPVNAPLHVDSFSNKTMIDPNRWQPLTLTVALDQGGNPIPSTPSFIGPEWGKVTPFAMNPANATLYFRNGFIYTVHKNPGTPPKLDTVNVNSASSDLFKWGHSMVAVWSSHLDPDDTTMIDISPASTGNVQLNPSTITESKDYYKFFAGGDTGKGYILNPFTNAPYTPELVKRGDFTRVVSQFWADGPKSETPPGHWFVLLNDVGDHPLFEKKFQGVGDLLSNLEWDIKSYFALGGAMHDAAIAAWGIKGWYDSPRPISAIRKMARYGQSSNNMLPNYHPGGLPLIPDYIELINSGDSLAGTNNEFVNKIKIKAWRGFSYIADSSIDVAKSGWILAEKWMPYQRKTFVTPPFAGYVSGHSTYSRAGAEVLTLLTGSNYFPGGLAEYEIPANSGYLVIEQGPTTNIKLQWATYQDASNQASLSRIWGGIHPPFDDIAGRLIGQEIGIESFNTAKTYFNSSPLPVTLHAYSVTENNCNAKIEWETSNEKNIQSFTILHSKDGKLFDRKINEIVATNNSSSLRTHYQVIDYTPSENGYYQLIENDFENNSNLIATKALNLSNCLDAFTTESVSVFPNPFEDLINIRIQTLNNYENASIEIIDLLGRNVFTSTFNHVSKVTTKQLNVSSIPQGNYLLKVTLADGKQYVSKLVKK
jgi:hypothetical protein